MLNEITRSQKRFFRKCALVITTSLFLTLVIYSSFDKIISHFNYYFTQCNKYTSNLLLSSGFTIDEVIIIGNKFTDKKDILSLIDRAQPIIYIWLVRLANDIKSVNKWIKDVRVYRLLPNKLYIDIDEHKPFALWKDNNKTAVIDSEGKIIIDNYSIGLLHNYYLNKKVTAHFDVIPDRDDVSCQSKGNGISEDIFRDLMNNLVIISGQNSLSNLKFVRDILNNKTQLSEQISSFVFVGNRRWNIILDNGPIVKLPEDDPYSAWNYLNSLQDTTDFLLRDWSIIDMRILDKIFVKR